MIFKTRGQNVDVKMEINHVRDDGLLGVIKIEHNHPRLVAHYFQTMHRNSK